MKTVDRYLLRQFVWTWLVSYLSLTGLYVVFDAFSNLEEFLRYGEKHGHLPAAMATYYACHSALFFDRVAPLLTLIAAMFTVTWIQRNHEMTALLAAGIPRGRVIAPILVAGCLMALASAANRELVLPQLREQLSLRPQDLAGDHSRPLTPRYDNQTDILLGGAATYRDRKRVAKPNFLLPPELSNYGRLLIAEEAFYQEAKPGRPAGYLLVGVEKPENIAELSSIRQQDKPVVITPRDAPGWLKPNQCFVVSGVSFDQLAAGNAFAAYSSTASLIAALRNRSLDFGAEVRVTIHSRIVQPVLDVTLLFLGLPLVVWKESRNVFLAIGMCAGVVAAFLVVVMAFQYLGSTYSISPAFAAWAPLMICVPVAVALSDSLWY